MNPVNIVDSDDESQAVDLSPQVGYHHPQYQSQKYLQYETNPEAVYYQQQITGTEKPKPTPAQLSPTISGFSQSLPHSPIAALPRSLRSWGPIQVRDWVYSTLISRWNQPDVASRIAENFVAHLVDGKVLSELSENEWREIVPEVAPRHYLMSSQKKLKRTPVKVVPLIRLLENISLAFLTIGFVISIVATAYPGWTKINIDDDLLQVGLWRVCSVSPFQNNFRVSDCFFIGENLKDGRCTDLFRTVRAFSILGIIISGLAVLSLLHGKYKEYLSLSRNWKLSFVAFCCSGVSWAVFIAYRVNCQQPSFSYDVSFGLQVAACGLFLFASIALLSLYPIYKPGTSQSSKTNTQSPSQQSYEIFKKIVLTCFVVCFISSVIATSYAGWVKQEQDMNYTSLGLWRGCQCGEMKITSSVRPDNEIPSVTPICVCSPTGEILGSGRCPDLLRTVKAFSLLTILLSAVTVGALFANKGSHSTFLSFLTLSCSVVCWAVFIGYKQSCKDSWNYDASFGLQVAASGFAFFGCLASFIMYYFFRISTNVPKQPAASITFFYRLRQFTFLIVVIALVAAIIATAYPEWTKFSQDKSYGTLGLWRVCQCEQSQLYDLPLCRCNFVSEDIASDSCLYKYRVVRAFSIIGIVLTGLSTVGVGLLFGTKDRFTHSMVTFLLALSFSSLLICWAVYTGFHTDCVKALQSGAQYGASFGLQISSFGLAFIAAVLSCLSYYDNAPNQSQQPSQTGSSSPRRQYKSTHAQKVILTILSVSFTSAVIATTYSGWARNVVNSSPTTLGLWQACTCTSPNNYQFGMPACVCAGLSESETPSRCNDLFRTIRAFSIIGIVFIGLAAFPILNSIWTGRKKITGLTNSMKLSGVGAAASGICWAVYIGFKVNCISDFHYDASFGLQICAFILAVYAFVITGLVSAFYAKKKRDKKSAAAASASGSPNNHPVVDEEAPATGPITTDDQIQTQEVYLQSQYYPQ